MLGAGIFLQNRYEIISCIGSGGMADVYKAKDHKLNRFVAVKVLKSEFREDKSFLSKFRVEAQAAAGLSHTNIVNVYDVGVENGINFIVMELVEGITLKAYISKKGKLSVREATSIALQVAAGLEAAHNNGIIHRDVKPQNILISMDGKAKIADFGIARAASSDTYHSVAMGSVHYCSPEQARGGYSDAKSDIYSMGITMYEMLTGRVPFDGESTVEIALHHLQDDMPSPKKFTPEIPFSTEQIILKCTQKSPDRRYANMGELIRDLKESLVNPNGNFVVIRMVDPRSNTVQLSENEVRQIQKNALPSYDTRISTGAAGSHSESGSVSGSEDRNYPYRGSYYNSSSYQDVSHYGDAGDPRAGAGEEDSHHVRSGLDPDGNAIDDDSDLQDRRERRKKKKKNAKKERQGSPAGEKFVTVIGILAAVTAGLVLLVFAGRALGLFRNNVIATEASTQGGQAETAQNTLQDNTVTVPYLLGRTEEEASRILKDLELGGKYQGESPSSDYPKGQVVSQSVAAGSVVEKHTTVGYVISAGTSETVTVPELSRSAQSEAEQALKSMGLVVSVDNSRYSDTIEEGHVITTNPGAGSPVRIGSTVTIFVSQGKDTSHVKVPNVTGHYLEHATQTLSSLGLYYYTVEQSSDTEAKGIVIAQDIPEGETVATGSAITLTVSTGPESDDAYVEYDENAVWKCNAQLKLPPDEYEDNTELTVRIILEQGETTTTVYEGVTTFPYFLNTTGASGQSTGTVYVHILDPATWEETAAYVYEGVAFTPE